MDGTGTLVGLLTDPNSIINDVNDKLKLYEDKLEELLELSVNFVSIYDNNIIENFGDSTDLKNRMKLAVMMAVNNEL